MNYKNSWFRSKSKVSKHIKGILTLIIVRNLEK